MRSPTRGHTVYAAFVTATSTLESVPPTCCCCPSYSTVQYSTICVINNVMLMQYDELSGLSGADRYQNHECNCEMLLIAILTSWRGTSIYSVVSTKPCIDMTDSQMLRVACLQTVHALATTPISPSHIAGQHKA